MEVPGFTSALTTVTDCETSALDNGGPEARPKAE